MSSEKNFVPGIDCPGEKPFPDGKGNIPSFKCFQHCYGTDHEGNLECLKDSEGIAEDIPFAREEYVI